MWTISQLFVQLERDREVVNIEKFKNKKTECLNQIKKKFKFLIKRLFSYQICKKL